MGKIDEKKRIKQESLLYAAFELFTEQGIHNTSISDIVKRAKMAKGTFYLYFKDKYDIRDRLITKHASALFEEASRVVEQQEWNSLEEKVVALVDNIMDQLNENPAVLRFISKNLSWAVFSNIRIAERDNRNCMDIFEELVAESGRSFRDQDLMIFMIVELINATCYNTILKGQPVTFEKLKPEINTTVCSLIRQFEEDPE